MTALYLRTDSRQTPPEDAQLLDWFGGAASTISGSTLNLTRRLGAPSRTAEDLLRLAVAVYGADRSVRRDLQPDRWRRELRLHVPVTEVAMWRDAAPAFIEALTFLTNDSWSLQFRAVPPTEWRHSQTLSEADCVSLFSGGLDSLAGAINLLEAGKKLLLVGHYDSNLLLPRQQHLVNELQTAYGVENVEFHPFYLRLNPRSPSQARPLPKSADRENTTRSRSFLFIAAANVVASVVGVPDVHVPENGYIGLNVPLETSRLGACSTRTTHPHFFALLQEALSAIGGPCLLNPFEAMTKGEVLQNCGNRDLLLALASSTVSCAHPEVGRWKHESYRNCGYCYPCLMRRIALHTLGADNAAEYRVDVGDPAVLRAGGVKASHLRALVGSIRRNAKPTDVLRSGPLPRGRIAEFGGLYRRGRDEIATWLDAAVPASH